MSLRVLVAMFTVPVSIFLGPFAAGSILVSANPSSLYIYGQRWRLEAFYNWSS